MKIKNKMIHFGESKVANQTESIRSLVDVSLVKMVFKGMIIAIILMIKMCHIYFDESGCFGLSAVVLT